MPNNVKSCKKIDEKAQTAKFTVLQGEISSAVLKTWKTRKTKTWITQIFQILYTSQGTTMLKLTSWGFRKCGSFCPGEFLKRSYWLSKSSNFSIFFKSKMWRHKNIARIANAVHCHSWLSGNKNCHEFRFSIVRIVISVSIVTSLQDYLVSQVRYVGG